MLAAAALHGTSSRAPLPNNVERIDSALVSIPIFCPIHPLDASVTRLWHAKTRRYQSVIRKDPASKYDTHSSIAIRTLTDPAFTRSWTRRFGRTHGTRTKTGPYPWPRRSLETVRALLPSQPPLTQLRISPTTSHCICFPVLPFFFWFAARTPCSTTPPSLFS